MSLNTETCNSQFPNEYSQKNHNSIGSSNDKEKNNIQKKIIIRIWIRQQLIKKTTGCTQESCNSKSKITSSECSTILNTKES